MKFLLSILCLVLISTAATANEHRLPDGVTALNLSVTESVKIDEDLIVSNLRYESKGEDATAIQNEINAAMGKALELIKQNNKVDVTTQSYSVHMRSKREGRGDDVTLTQEWHGKQALTMKSQDFEAIQDLTGQLQEAGFLTSGFQYTLSPEKSRLVKENLMKGAIEKLKRQAQSAADALGKKGYDIREINIDGGHFFPRPIMARGMMAMAESAMAPPQAAGGEEEVSLTINARVELK